MSNAKYSMHGYFISGFPKLIRYSDKHELLIKTFLPKVHTKLVSVNCSYLISSHLNNSFFSPHVKSSTSSHIQIKCNITPLIYTTKWFLQCYLDSVGPCVTLILYLLNNIIT